MESNTIENQNLLWDHTFIQLMKRSDSYSRLVGEI